VINQTPYALDTPFGHQLSFALLPLDHFTRQAIGEELRVVVDTKINPVRSSDGLYRNSDGTYRFIDLAAGNHSVSYQSLSGFYVSFDSPLSVLTPISSPTTAITRDLWPTPAAPIATAMTAIRGSLSGTNSKNVIVQIAATGQPFDRYTQTDLNGNFLFLIPSRLNPVSANDSHIAVSIVLNGGAFVPSNINVYSNGTTTTFAGTSNFQIVQGAQSRVTFTVP
jgi:hypothetical protein